MIKFKKYLKFIKNKLYYQLNNNSIESYLLNLYKNQKEILYRIVIKILSNNSFLKSHNLRLNDCSINYINKKIIINFQELYNEFDFELKINIFNLLIDSDLIDKLFIEKIQDQDYNYKLLKIYSIIKNKINEGCFFDNLEKNYGIFLDSDDFINEINQKLYDIKNINIFKNDINEYIIHIFSIIFYLDHNIDILNSDNIYSVFDRENRVDIKNIKYLQKSMKEIEYSFKFYDWLYKKKEKRNNDSNKDNIELNVKCYNKLKAKYNKELRQIKKEERYNKRKQIKLFKNGNNIKYLKNKFKLKRK